MARLRELTWPDAKRRLQEVDIALLPIGAIEQHGPHLPLDTDVTIALEMYSPEGKAQLLLTNAADEEDDPDEE